MASMLIDRILFTHGVSVWEFQIEHDEVLWARGTARSTLREAAC